MSILKICHYEIKDISGSVAIFHYLDKERITSKTKSEVVQANRDIKINSLCEGVKAEGLLDPNDYDEMPIININLKQIDIKGKFLNDTELNNELFSIIDKLPTNDSFTYNVDKIEAKIHKSICDINIAGYGNSISILSNPIHRDILDISNLAYRNIEFNYDLIIPNNKIFVYSKPKDIEIGLKVYRSENRYFIADIKLEEVIKVIAVK